MEQIKKLLLILVLILVSSAQELSAQISPTNVQELMSYFESHIQSLDPIEGVYDVNIEQWGENAYQEFPSETTNLTMLVYKNANGEFKVFKNDQVTIKKIGETPVYNYNLFWKGSNVTDSKRFVLKESTFFDVKYSIPDRQLRYDMGRNYQAGFKVHYKCSFIKTYPTVDMYVNDIEDENIRDPKEWSGTGFALKNNYIVTNYHVIEDAKSIWIQGVNGDFNTKYTASIVASDKFNDLAILKVEGVTVNTSGIPYSVKTSTSEVGEDVFVLGYPLTSTMGEEIKLTTGVVSSKTGFQGDVSLYQISAPIQPGNSGGPLFDGNGNIIGIVSAKHTGAENVGYAIKASYLRNLMESALSENILPQTNKIASYKLSDKVKSLKNYVYYITCSSSNSNNSSLNNSNNTGGSVSFATEKAYNNPYINRNMSNSLKVLSVKLQDNQTVITFSDNNRIDDDNYYQWFSINKNAYIVANGQRYTLTRAEGIAMSPDITYFSYAGETKTFTLYFPAIPKSATSIDFIEAEDSNWRLYGIQLR